MNPAFRKNSIFGIILLLLSISIQVQAQNTIFEEYNKLIKEAFNLYKVKDFKKAAITYEQAFKLYTPARTDIYNAACSWSLAGEKNKAFKYLNLAAKNKYASYNHLISDKDFVPLYSDKRWEGIKRKVNQNQLERETKYGAIIKSLSTVMEDDQKYRIQIDSVYQKFGGQSAEYWKLSKAIHKQDSINLIIVRNIIDTHGWLGPDEAGANGANALFLVIQHADLAVQKQYLPIMRDAVKKSKALPQNLALLEDRIQVKEGKKQIYGSQLETDLKTNKLVFLPIEDEPNVNKRRASVGLGTLEEYAKGFQLEYKLPAAKE